MSEIESIRLNLGESLLQFAYFTKMMTVNGQCYRQRQEPRTAEKRPHEQIPILNTFFAENSDSDRGAKNRQKALEVHRDRNLGGFIFPQEGFYASVIGPGPIDIV